MTAAEARSKMNDLNSKVNQTQLAEVENLIEAAIKKNNNSCIARYDLTNAVKAELERIGYTITYNPGFDQRESASNTISW